MNFDQTKTDKVNRNQIFSGVVWGQISRIGDIGLSLLFSLLVVRILGKEEYGTYSVILSLISASAVISGFGLSETLNRFLPETRISEPHSYLALFRQFLILRFIGSFFSGIILLILTPYFSGFLGNPAVNRYGVLLLILMVNYGLNDLISNYYISRLQLKFYFLVRSLTQLAGIAFTLGWFFFSKPEAFMPLFVLAFTLGTQFLVYFIRLPGMSLFQKEPLPGLLKGKIYNFARDLWSINIFTYALAGQFDILALGFLLKDPVQVAYYSLITLIMFRIQSLVTGWATASTSVFSSVQASEGKEGLRRYFLYYYKLSLLTMLPSVGWVFTVATGLIPLVFGSEYNGAVPLILVFNLHLFISCLTGAVININLILALGRQNQVLKWRIFFSLLNIILDVLLIPQFGAMGAVLATGFSNSLLHAVELVMVRDIVRGLPWKFIFKLVGALILAVSGATGAVLQTHSYLNQVAVGSCFFTLILIGMLFILKPFEQVDLLFARRWMPKFARRLSLFVHN